MDSAANAAANEGVFKPLEAGDPEAVAGYRLSARLGAGGMGKVYLSYTPGGRAVAVKVIRPEFSEDPEFRRRFKHEVDAAQRVQGLYTAPVIDAETEGPRPWLATAYVPGPSLADAVGAHGPLPVPTVLLLVAGIAEALHVIHGAGIVHRDLKPSNVLLASDGPRVIDFGIARAADATSLTSSGVTVGTPSFMAPEQAAGREVTAATDVFALGQVAAYAALGTPAFGEGTGHGVLYRIVHEDPELTALPDEVRELVTRCLAKDPAARPSVMDVITLCQAANAETSLRRPEEWLPSAVAADITSRVAAPAPPLAPPAAPAVPPAPSMAPAVPAAPPAGYVPTQASTPTTPPPGFGPAAPWPATAPPTPVPQLPTQPSAAVTVPAPAPARRKGRLVAAAVAGILVFAAAGAGTAYVLTKDDGSDKDPQSAQGAGDTASPAGHDTTPSTTPGDDGTPGDDDGQGSASPEPTGTASSTVDAGAAPDLDKRGVNVVDSYHLTFTDDALRPVGDDSESDVGYSWQSDSIQTDGRLILLSRSEAGTLETCRTETRYASSVGTDSLSKGQQICVLTDAGDVGLVTYQGLSPDSDPSRYVTLDVKVWRGAL
ncbi:serine/threonine-protein kinase [Streptomyces sp. NPDC001315]|uniref:serine/threonine-protein kinase n=1 Tax=Streptomyces sp. NPDC001315 TaxID=3364562 RepID=UPI0036803550